MGRVLEDMSPMLRRLLGEDVDMQLSIHPRCPAVYADPHQIEQVIMNLAVNARDAMPTGGCLRIETRPSKPGEGVNGDGQYAVLTVTDSGGGMDEATRLHLFEPFFTTKPVGKGTGLGLSTVQGIVTQSGGLINVESEPGKGSTFSILLPAVACGTVPADQPNPGSSPYGKGQILVVEDEPAVRMLVTTVLKQQGHSVLQARDGEEALAIFSQNMDAIDLVLTDVVMPHMSGRQLLTRLEQLRPGIKALFMSGYADDVTLRHGALGAHLIQKPFTPEDLAAKVASLLK